MVQDFKNKTKNIILLKNEPGIINKNLKIKSY